ncbi:MAG: Heme-binding protein A [Nitrospira sp.]|nr:Heme-binding protein A [Nitrospira sp.]
MVKHRLITLLILASAILALACGPSAGQGPGAAPDKPKPGGIYRQNITDDMFNWDMSLQASSVPNPFYTKVAYSSLLGRKLATDVPYGATVVEPNLAESWEVSADAKTYTFHLAKGIKFANIPPVNGRELTSKDVKFSYEYMARFGEFSKVGASQFAYLFAGLDTIETPDPYTVVVKFKESYAPFINYAASSDNLIMPREIFDADGSFKDKIVGSGPYQADVAGSQAGSKWVMKKNPTYFKAGLPYMDEIQFIILKDLATQQAAFKSKQIDFFTVTDFRAAQEIRTSIPEAVETSFPNTPAIIGINSKRPPFNDFKVRKAFSMSIDRDEVIKILQGGEGGWALAFSNVRDDLFTQAEIKSILKYDVEGAKKLLAEAGYANGVSAEFLFTAGTPETEALVQLLQAQWKKAGINLTLKPVDNNENVARRRSREFDILNLSEAAYSDLDGSLSLAIAKTGSFNYNQIDDPKVEEFLAAQRREGNPEKRTQILKDVLRYVNESGWAIGTWRRQLYMFTHSYVHDFYHNADYRSQGIPERTWLSK